MHKHKQPINVNILGHSNVNKIFFPKTFIYKEVTISSNLTST